MSKNPSVTKNNTLLKIGDAAKILGVSIDTLRRWEKAGKIKAQRTPGGTRLYSLSALKRVNPDAVVTEEIEVETTSTEELLKKASESTSDILTHQPADFFSSDLSESDTPIHRPSDTLKKSFVTRFLIGSAVFSFITLLLTAWITASYLTSPKETAQFFKNNIASGVFKPFHILAEETLTVIDPKKAKELGFVPPDESPPLIVAKDSNKDSNVLAVTSTSPFLEVNADTQINGSLFVRDSINGLSFEATPSAGTIALNAGSTTLTVTNSATLDQDVSTTASPSFSSIQLSADTNQITKGSLNFTLPSTSGTLVTKDSTDTLKNKSMSGADNTFTAIPNSALSNSKVTVTAGTNLSGGGDVELGSSVTLALKASPSVTNLTASGIVSLADGTAAAPSLTFTNDLNSGLYSLAADKIGLITGGTATQGITIDASGNVGIATITPSQKLEVVGTAKVTTLNATTAIQLNGTNINTGGTLTNVAYLDQANAFTANQNFNLGFDVDDAFVIADGGALTTSQTSTFNGALYFGTSTGILTSTGNVGIGNTNPGSMLSLSGNATIGFGGVGSIAGPSNGLGISGNLGVGTTSPNNKLQVIGAGVFGANYGQYSAASNGLLVEGNVGIGATTSSNKLDVWGNTRIAGTLTVDSTLTASSGLIGYSGVTAPTNGLAISGNLGIGTTSATTPFFLTNNATTTTIASFMGDSITSGKLFDLSVDALTTGTGLNLTSTSTAFSSGYLANLDWSPTTSTTATGSLLNIGIGVSGMGANYLNLTDAGSSIFSISKESLTTSLPVSFNSPGDVSIAYDINMTNPTTSNIKSQAPLTITAGEIFNSSDLTLQTYNFGNLILAPNSGNLWADGTNVGIGTTNPQTKLYVNGNAMIGYSTGAPSSLSNGLAVSGNVGIGTSGPSYKFQVNTGSSTTFINSSGNVGIGATTSSNKLDVWGNARIAGTLTVDSTITPSGQFLAIDGSKSAPSYSFASSGNEDSGMYLPSANALSFATAGNDVLTLTAGGNVGIGNTAPLAPLSISNTGSLQRILLQRYGGANDANSAAIDLTEGADSTQSDFGTTSGYGFRIKYDGSGNFLTFQSGIQSTVFDTLTILRSNGNIGLGNTNPGAGLSVSENAVFGFGGATSIAGPSNGLGISGSLGVGTTSPNNKLQVIGAGVFGANYGQYAAPSNGLLVEGNVGIGWTSPAAKLHILSESPQLIIDNPTGGASEISNISLYKNGVSKWRIDSRNSNEGKGDDFWISSGGSTPEFMIDATTGNIGINTQSPVSKLHLIGTGTSTAPTIMTQNSTQTNFGLAVLDNSNVGIGTTNPLGKLSVSGTPASSANYGLVSIGSGNWAGTGSDFASGDAQGTYLAINSEDNTRSYVDIQRQGNAIFKIDQSGQVSIGTGTAYAALEVSGDQRLSGTLTGVTGLELDTNDASQIKFSVNGSEKTRITTGGNLGIGTSSPNSMLSVAGGAHIGALYQGTSAPTNGLFVDGNVGIGATTSSNKLDVWGDARITGSLTVDGTTTYGGGLTISGNILPSLNDTYDLGSDSYRWQDIYLGPGSVHVGTSTSDEYVMTYDTTNNRLGFNVNGSGPAEIVMDSSGNVGIGVTDPASRLHVKTTSDGLNSTFRLDDGSDTTEFGIYQYTNDNSTTYLQDSVMLYTGTDTTNLDLAAAASGGTIRFRTTGWNSISNERMRITSSGNIGIGTTGPSAKLDVAGNIRLSGASPTLYQDNSNDDLSIRSYRDMYIDINSNADSSTSRKLYFREGSSYATIMTLQGGGNVGIGTASPVAQLDLRNTNTSTGLHAYIGSSAGQFGVLDNGRVGIGTTNPGTLLELFASSTPVLNFNKTGETSLGKLYATSDGGDYTDMRLTLQSRGSGGTFIDTLSVKNGNVGIGTTTPDGTLEVEKAADAIFLVTDTGGAQLKMLASSTIGYIGTNTAHNLMLRTNDITRVTIDTSGNVGIGTTGPGYKLDVNGAIMSYNQSDYSGQLLLGGREIGGSNQYGDISFSAGGYTSMTLATYYNDARNFINFKPANVETMRLLGSGNVGIGLTTANSQLSVSNNAHIGSLFQGASAPTNGLFVDGNVGIGATTSNNKLDVWGNARIAGTLTIDGNTTLSNTLTALSANGYVGIGTATPHAPLQIGNSFGVQNRKIVLWESTDNDHEYYGFGINANTLRYQVSETAANHVFYAATGSSASNELMRINGSGNIGIGGDTSPDSLFAVGSTSQFQVNSSGAIAAVTGITTSGGYTQSGTGINYFSGNVGIGFTSPLARLQVGTTSDTTAAEGISFGGDVSLYRVNGNRLQTDDDFYFGGTIASKGGDFYLGGTNARLYSSGGSYWGTTGFADPGANNMAIRGNLTLGVTGTTEGKITFLTTGGETAPYINAVAGNLELNTNGTGWVELDTDNGVQVTGDGGNLWWQANSGNAIFDVYNDSAATSLIVKNSASNSVANFYVPNGNVGIGTSNPTQKLQIGSASTSGAVLTHMVNDGGGFYFGTASNNIVFDAGRNDYYDLTILGSTGNVGIGTTNPTQKLDVNGSMALTNTLYFGGRDDTFLEYYGTASLRMRGGGNDALLINSNGNIAIGALDPGTTKLYVNGNVGIGTTTANSNLSISGNAHIGSLYQGISAPSNGLFVDGNVGIGATTSNNKLDVWGNARIAGTLTVDQTSTFDGNLTLSSGQFLGANGSASLPAYSFTNLTNAGLWTNGDGLLLTTGGSSTKGLTVTAAGNVGIGITSPASNLHVKGASNWRGTVIADSTSGYSSFGLYKAGTREWSLYNHSESSDNFSIARADDTDVFKITQTGNIGIGANYTPTQLFDVNGKFVVNGTAGNIGVGTLNPAARFQVNTTNSNPFVVTSTGLVGIGTTNPDYELQIKGTGTQSMDITSSSVTGYTRQLLHDISGGYTQLAHYGGSYDGNNLFNVPAAGTAELGTIASSLYLGTRSNSPIYFGTNALVRTTIAADGNVGIGTTGPSQKLEVAGNIQATSGEVRLNQGYSLQFGPSGYYMQAPSTTRLGIFTAGNETVSINNSGNVGIGFTSPNSELYVRGAADSVYDPIARFNSTSSQIPIFLYAANTFTGVLKGDSSSNVVLGSGTGEIAFYTGADGATTEGSPRLRILNGGNVGLGNNITPAGLFQVGNNATPPLFVASSTGNVGIGTTGPDQKLHVYDTANSYTIAKVESASHDKLWLTANLGYNEVTSLNSADGYQQFYLNASAISLRASASDTNAIHLVAGGNVGIGTNSPKAQLDVRNTNTSTGLHTYIGSSAGQFGILDNGNVGIGTTAPNTKLEVDVSSASTGLGQLTNAALRLANINTTTNNQTDIIFTDDSTAYTAAMGVQYTDHENNYGNLYFSTRGASNDINTPNMLIDQNGNVGIGFTSPNALLHIGGANQTTAAYGIQMGSDITLYRSAANTLKTDNNLVVGGTITSSGTQFLGANGSAAAPAYSFTNLTNAGLWTNGDGLLLTTGGSNTSGITVTGAGRVGIGATNPAAQLEIAGTGNAILLQNQGILRWKNASGTGDAYLQEYSDNKLYFGINGADRMTLDSNGNVGIASNVIIGYSIGSTPASLANGLAVSGNVGIGTTNPTSNLYVAGTGYLSSTLQTDGNLLAYGSGGLTLKTSTNPRSIRMTAGGDNSNYTDILSYDAAPFTINSSYSNGFRFQNGGVSNLVINGNGNVGIGTSQPNAKLSIQGSVGIGYTGANQIMPANGLAVFGNVGIGTTSPAKALEVNGDILLQNNTQLYGKNTTGSVTGLIKTTTNNLTELSTSHHAYFVNYLGVNATFTSQPASVLSVNGNLSLGADYYGVAAPTNGAIIQGNVGIGTTNPLTTFQIGSVPTPAIFANLGNVGIGTTALASRLSIGGNVSITDTSDTDGTGTDGACSVTDGTVTLDAGSSNTCAGRATADSANFNIATSLSVGSTTINVSATPTGIAAGDEILVINLRGTSSDYNNVGKYETHYVTSVSGNILTLDSPLVNTYDGTTQKIMVQRIPQYTTVTIGDSTGAAGSAVLTIGAYNNTTGKGGVIFFRATGAVTINSDGKVDGGGKGYTGGTGVGSQSSSSGGLTYNGTGGAGGANGASGSSGQGGGGGKGAGGAAAGTGTTGGAGGAGGANNGGGGGGGGYGAVGTGGTTKTSCLASSGSGTTGGDGSSVACSYAGSGGGGGTYGSTNLTQLYFGSGGGGGGADNTAGGTGGNGGGIVFISASSITVTGSISANGNVGGNGDGNSGGAGGGAGGSVYIKAQTQTLGSSLVTTSAGSGGTAGASANVGGAGGAGRIRLDYTSATGATSPGAGYTGSISPSLYINRSNSIGDILGLQYAGTDKFRIDSSGNILSAVNSIWQPMVDSTRALGIGNSASQVFVSFDTQNQRVGIGTTGPASLLNTSESSSAVVRSLSLDNTNSTANSGVGIAFRGIPDQSVAIATLGAIDSKMVSNSGNAADTIMSFSTSLDSTLYERMRIDQNGNLGIGTTGPNNGTLEFGNTTPIIYSNNALQIITANNKAITLQSGNSITLNTNTGATGTKIFNTSGNALSVFTATDTEPSWTYSPTGIAVSGVSEFAGNVFAKNNVLVTSGNVGIGTTNPTFKLYVSGASGNQIGINSTLDTAGTIHFDNNGVGKWEIYNNGGGAEEFMFYSYGAEGSIMTMQQAGNIGIGLAASSPTAQLDVRSTNTSTGRLFYAGSSAGQFAILDNGNVGIGTSSPTGQFTVKSSGNGALVYRAINSSGNDLALIEQDSNGDGNLFLYDSAGVGRIQLRSDSSDSYIWAGNVGIGTTNPSAPLHIANNTGPGSNPSTGTYLLTLENNTSGWGSPSILFKGTDSANMGSIELLDNGGNSGKFFFKTGSGTLTTKMVIDTNGNVGIGTTNPTKLLYVAGTASINGNLDVASIKDTADGTYLLDPANTGNSLIVAGNVGIGTTGPTHPLTLGSGSNGIVQYFSADQTTNYGRVRMYYDTGGNNTGFHLITEAEGSFDQNRANLFLDSELDWEASGRIFTFNSSQGGGSGNGFIFQNTGNANRDFMTVHPTVATTGGDRYTALLVNVTESSTGTGFNLIQDWQVGGTSKMVINNAGNVGIGTSNPSSALDIKGTVTIRDPNNTNTTGAISVSNNAIAGNQAGTFIKGEAIGLANNNSTNHPGLVILSGGNVGIGITNPARLLDVNGTANFSGIAYFADGGVGSPSITFANDTDTGLARVNADSMILQAGGAEKVRINSSGMLMGSNISLNGYYLSGDGDNEGIYVTSAGNVGIGFTSPIGKFQITDTSNAAASFTLSNNTATTIGNGANTLGVLDLGSTSLTTGNFLNIELNALSSGKGLNLTSTSTAFSSGYLANLDWSPTSSTTATGSLLNIGIGVSGMGANYLNLTDAGSSIFSISKESLTTSLPTSFTAAGDVSMAYDLNMTNPTTANIKSAAPLTITAGEVFNSSDLTLQTYNFGNLILAPNTGNLWADGTNVGIGTTNPQTKLYVNGNAMIGYSTGAPSSLSNGLAVSGNVGIGTSNPTAKLDVNGMIMSRTGTSYTAWTVNALSMGYDGSYDGGWIQSGGAAAGDSLLLNPNGGNVGIGTVTPTRKLEIVGESLALVNASANQNNNIFFGKTDGTDGWSVGQGVTTADGNFRIYDNQAGNTPITIEQGTGANNLYLKGGNVGIGFTSPAALLHVGTNTTTAAGGIQFGSDVKVYRGGAATLNIENNLTIGADGNATNYKLVGFMGANDRWEIFGEGSSDAGQLVIATQDNANEPIVFRQADYLGNNNDRMTINSSGNVVVATDLYTHDGGVHSSSDIRLKNVNGSYTKGLAEILNLNPIEFNFKSDNPLGLDSTRQVIGLSAQEVQSQIPEAVDVDGKGYLTLTQGPIFYAMVNAFKELNNQIVSLHTDTATSSAAIAALQTQQATDSAKLSKIEITDSGNVGIGTTDPGSYALYVNGSGFLNDTAWTYASDSRLKENVTSIGTGLDVINALNPVTFDYTNGGQNRSGFIAQEVQQVLPDLVSQRADGMLTLRTDEILPYAVEAIQQLSNKINNLQIDADGTLIVEKLKAGTITLDPSIQLAQSTSGESGPTPEVSVDNTEVNVMTKIASLEERIQQLEAITAAAVAGEATSSAALAEATSSALLADSTAEATSSADIADALELTDPSVLIATSSASLAINQPTLTVSEATVSGTLTAYDLNVQNGLKALGKTTLADTTIAGTLTVDGTLSVENGSEINVIGALYLQKSILADSLDILDGAFTFDKDGTLTVNGTVLAEQFSVKAGTTAGTGTITAGQIDVIVENEYTEENSVILITPHTALNQAIAVTTKVKGGFLVELAQPETQNISFDYLIVGVK